MWADEKTEGQAQNDIPVIVKFKHVHLLLLQKQYPLKPEIKEELTPIIDNLKEQGLLIPCNSPCNTPILGVKKSNDKWRLVQYLWIINEAIVALHSMVHNPYTLCLKFLNEPNIFQIIDLKDAFYPIPLVKESQILFAFEDPIQPAPRLTCTISHQGFCDSPHLFR